VKQLGLLFSQEISFEAGRFYIKGMFLAEPECYYEAGATLNSDF
jgi:hypothetical protein